TCERIRRLHVGHKHTIDRFIRLRIVDGCEGCVSGLQRDRFTRESARDLNCVWTTKTKNCYGATPGRGRKCNYCAHERSTKRETTVRSYPTSSDLLSACARRLRRLTLFASQRCPRAQDG